MDYKRLIRSKEVRFRLLNLFSWVPDKIWLSFIFRIKEGYWMSFKNPKTFNEKLQWLKIYDFKPWYSNLVDKFEVKDYVAGIIGSKYVVPNYGVWNSPEEIEWDKLPDKFVLKTTDGGGSNGVIVCRDKSRLNKEEVVSKLHNCSVLNGRAFREKPYYSVKTRILAEEVLTDASGSDASINDYKFFCFNGEPKFLYMADSDNHLLQFINLDWTPAPFGRSDYSPYKTLPSKPDALEEMIEISRKLSKGFAHIRVDLYYVNKKIYFGELTFYTAGGFIPFDPKEYDLKLGEMIEIS